jgi:hypothetical protein
VSIDLALGLSLQALALAVVLIRVRGLRLSFTGVVFVMVAAVYHGAAEIVQVLFPGHNAYRTMVSQAALDHFTLVAGAAILLFAVTYARILQQGPRCLPPRPEDLQRLAGRLPDWRVVLPIAVAGLFVAISGRNFGYWISSVSTYLTSVLMVSASVALLLRVGSAHVLPALIVQSVAFALAGWRGPVVINALLLLTALRRLAFPVRIRQVVGTAAVVGALIVLISASRVVGGRLDQQASSVNGTARVTWLSAGTQVLSHVDLVGDVANDFIYRFDGNSFGGMVAERLAKGHASAGLASFWHNFSLMVPSALNPMKLSVEPRLLFEEDYTVWFYNLPPNIDFISGMLGMLFSYYGSASLLIGGVLLGWLYASVDTYLSHRRTFGAFVLGMGFTWTALMVEGGVLAYFSIARVLLIFYVFGSAAISPRRRFATAARYVENVRRHLGTRAAADVNLRHAP